MLRPRSTVDAVNPKMVRAIAMSVLLPLTSVLVAACAGTTEADNSTTLGSTPVAGSAPAGEPPAASASGESDGDAATSPRFELPDGCPADGGVQTFEEALDHYRGSGYLTDDATTAAYTELAYVATEGREQARKHGVCVAGVGIQGATVIWSVLTGSLTEDVSAFLISLRRDPTVSMSVQERPEFTVTSSTPTIPSAETSDFGPPPDVAAPTHPVVCNWWRHTPTVEPQAPWVIEYVSSTEHDGLIAYRGLDGAMHPSDWQRSCSRVVGP